VKPARPSLIALLCLVLALSLAPASASASFGFKPEAEGFGVTVESEDGSPATLSGTHPYELHMKIGLNEAGGLSEGDVRDLHLELPPGVLLTDTVDECNLSEFSTPRVSPFQESLSGESCVKESQVGTLAVRTGGVTRWFGLFNLVHPPGSPMALGASPFGIPILATVSAREADGVLSLDVRNLSQAHDFQQLEFTLWGMPWAAVGPGDTWTFWHDNERGNCLNEEDIEAPFGVPAQPVPNAGPPPYFVAGTCSADSGDPRLYVPPSYVSLPTSCEGPLQWSATARSWQGEEATASAETPAVGQCVAARSVAEVDLFTQEAARATGLIFNIHSPDSFPLAAHLRLTSPPQAAQMSLPEGLTINPSLGAGLQYCTEAQFEREKIDTPPGAGCPDTAKIGTVSLEGLLGLGFPTVRGSVYLAEPYRNPNNSLIGLYVVIRDADRGVFFRPVGHVEPDPHTGRLQVYFSDLPELQYKRFTLTLREGQRSTMVSPPACGTHIGQLSLTPYSDPAARVENLSFIDITKGEGGGPCPGGTLAPFAPGLDAGSLNPFAGAYTPFLLRMTRSDAEQEITSYSATFPPGLLGKIAGVPFCPDAAIEAAKQRTGTEELERPSCPAAALVGRTLAGYGVGGTLAYAPGKLYLSGPYHGSPISITAIDSAIVGPFDLGVVVVRSAIRVDHESGQVSIDSAGSDPIPHILKGIPIHLRDIRVYVDRPNFTLNPTSCEPLATRSRLTGAARDLYSPADDTEATTTDPYQLLGCPELGYGPSFTLKLRGPKQRGGFPALRATYLPHPGDANIDSAAVTLPHSEFLAQKHLRDICTIRQFNTNDCPPDSIYGHARAFTPLLADPLEGTVYLRSSPGRPLPDLVIALRGLGGGLAIDLVGRIDSGKGGGMRARFADLPDAPVSKFVLTLQGGKRGLLENSANTCAGTAVALARFIAHNNKGRLLNAPLGVHCKAKAKQKGRSR
jgi:hypothetical protein